MSDTFNSREDNNHAAEQSLAELLQRLQAEVEGQKTAIRSQYEIIEGQQQQIEDLQEVVVSLKELLQVVVTQWSDFIVS